MEIRPTKALSYYFSLRILRIGGVTYLRAVPTLKRGPIRSRESGEWGSGKCLTRSSSFSRSLRKWFGASFEVGRGLVTLRDKRSPNPFRIGTSFRRRRRRRSRRRGPFFSHPRFPLRVSASTRFRADGAARRALGERRREERETASSLTVSVQSSLGNRSRRVE